MAENETKMVDLLIIVVTFLLNSSCCISYTLYIYIVKSLAMKRNDNSTV